MSIPLVDALSNLIERSRIHLADLSRLKTLRLYWLIGRLLSGQADGAPPLAEVSGQLCQKYGKRFHYQNLLNMRTFYQAFNDWKKIRPELSWAHYWRLSRVEVPEARQFYLEEAAANHWSSRELSRQIDALYFERQQRDGRGKNNGSLALAHAEALVKEHYILEFLGLEKNARLLERGLESALLDKLQEFLMELGRGFAFVARQQRVVTATGKQFYIDLVFYHFQLKCFVLVDLKVGELTHHDIGQMDMYVRLFEDKWRSEKDNPTIGVILCSKKDNTIVQYSMLQNSRQLYASTYQLYLPTEEELSEKVDTWFEEAAQS